MSALVLKLIAMATMFIDHMFASVLNPSKVDIAGIGATRIAWTGTTLYWLGRMVGRIAFPIFCFQIAEGVRYTKNWKRYLLRLGLLAIASEPFFDFTLKSFTINWKSQNVFFTLLLGMMVVTFMKVVDRDWKYLVWPVLTCGMAWIAENVLHTDYGWSGVAAICVMGLMNEPWEKLFGAWTPQLSQMLHVVFAALGLGILYYKNGFEIYGFLALIPIALYNGQKGYTSKKLQIGFYFFYPLHLLLLGIVAWCYH